MAGCRFEFDDGDLRAYNAYHVRDLLCFISSRGDTSEVYISGMDIQHYGETENTLLYNPPDASVRFRDIGDDDWRIRKLSRNDTTFEDMEILHVRKDSPTEAPTETLWFKGFIGKIDRHGALDSVTIGGKRTVPAFVVPIESRDFLEDSAGIASIYWSDTYGIVRYVQADGVVWTLDHIGRYGDRRP
jgi:hypothetical protein